MSQHEKADCVLFENRKCCANVKSSLIIVTPSDFVLNDLNLLSPTDATALFKAHAGDMFYAKTACCRRIAESSKKFSVSQLSLPLRGRVSASTGRKSMPTGLGR